MSRGLLLRILLALPVTLGAGACCVDHSGRRDTENDVPDPVGSGPAFSSAFLNIAVEDDGNLLVVGAGPGRILRVDPISGDRTVTSYAFPDGDFEQINVAGDGPVLGSIADITVDLDGRVVVLDQISLSVVLVDPNTGDRTMLWDQSEAGTNSVVDVLTGIAVEQDGHLVVASWRWGVDQLDVRVTRIDPINGDRTLVSGGDTGTGPTISMPAGIAVEADGMLVLLDSHPALIRIDPVTGDRVIVSDADTGRGPEFKDPLDLAVEEDGHLLIADSFLDAVLRVDPVTGDRVVVSDNGTGDGPALHQLRDIAIEGDGALVVVAGTADFDGLVLRIDPITGDRTVVSLGTCGIHTDGMCTDETERHSYELGFQVAELCLGGRFPCRPCEEFIGDMRFVFNSVSESVGEDASMSFEDYLIHSIAMSEEILESGSCGFEDPAIN